MGLVKHLLLWPITVPAALVEFSARQVEGVAHRELTDDGRVKEDLLALQMELEIGSIDEEEYLRREAEVMERLRETREWRVRLGMEKEWAPMEMAPRSPDAAGAADEDG
jgi:hypothetical protein